MRYRRIVATIGLLLLISSGTAAASWRAGVARVDITPQEPTWMAGFAARNHAAEGTLHALWAKALVLEDEQGGRVAIVTTDLIGMTREIADVVAERLAASTGLTREQVVFNSSHTHSGPVLADCAPIAYELDADQTAAINRYGRALVDKLAGVVKEAHAAMQPVELEFGEGKATFAKNRRPVRNGQDGIAPNAAGPVDHVVPVLRVCGEQGRPLAILFGYACHATTLVSNSYQYSGDYPGFAQLALEERYPGAIAMFMIGCGADSNPNPRGTVELAQQHGKALASAVEETLSGQLVPVREPLAVRLERVELPFIEAPSKAELEKRRGEGNVYQQRLTEVLLKRIEEHGTLASTYPCPVQVVRFGHDMALVALSGETVVDYALRLRRELPHERLWIAGYCNEVFAYVPSERVLAEGGYEGGGAMVYFGWHGPFQSGLEDRIVAKVKQLLAD